MSGMNTLEALVLRSWLGPLAPRLTHHASAPLPQLAVAAVTVLAPRYGGRAVLVGSMAAAVRRSAARGLPDLGLYANPEDLLAAVEALRTVEAPFLLAMEAPLPLERALQMAIDSVGRITGLGALLVPHTLRWLPLESREVLPLIGPEGLRLAAALLEDWLPRLSSAARAEASRDLGSLMSLLGHREDARTHFEAAGDTARVLLEECDEALEAQAWPLAAALATLCARAAEEMAQPALAAAAMRRQSSAAERQGDYDSASHHMRRSLGVASDAKDWRAVAAAQEELSRLAADQGDRDSAVSWLGQVWRLQQRQKNAAGEERALRLAGRLLAEGGSAGPGLVMLLAALDLAEVRDPHTAHGIRQYIVGFQYTLSDAEFQRLEPMFDQPREPVITAAFQEASRRAKQGAC